MFVRVGFGITPISGPGIECSSTLEWKFDSIDADGRVVLQATGTTGCITAIDMGCEVTPKSVAVAPSDGNLRLDYSTSPPTYSGRGKTMCNIKAKCSDLAPAVDTNYQSNWFATDRKLPFRPGKPLVDSFATGGETISWTWSPN